MRRKNLIKMVRTLLLCGLLMCFGFMSGCSNDDDDPTDDFTTIDNSLIFNDDNTSISGTIRIKIDEEPNDLISRSVVLKNFILKVGNCFLSDYSVSPETITNDSTDIQDLTISASFSEACFDKKLTLIADKVTTVTDSSTGKTYAPVTETAQFCYDVRYSANLRSPAIISLSSSQNSVKSDNSDKSAITATVLDANRSPLEGVDVSFTVSAGKITLASATTDANGQASTDFSAGVDNPTNQTVTISASITTLSPVQIPIKIVGSSVTLTTDITNVPADGSTTAQLKATVVDSSGDPVYNALVTFSTTETLSLSYSSGRTDVNGQITVTVTGVQSGSGVVTASALNETAMQTYSISEVQNVFKIYDPAVENTVLYTDQDYIVKIQGKDSTSSITVVTSLGYFTETSQPTYTGTVQNGEFWCTLRSGIGGIAEIQAYDTVDTSTIDTTSIIISPTVAQAAQISLQPNANSVAPSLGGIENAVTLSAIVKTSSSTSNNQVIYNVPVAFNISKGPGGGEYITPAVAFTNSSGVATSTFVAGSLSSGNEGIVVTASVVGMESINDEVKLTIRNTAGSFVIGGGTTITEISPTTYSLPFALMVIDSNGNAVAGATVSLSNWPVRYRNGNWVENADSGVCGLVLFTGWKNNEDVNRNLILDPGEDLNNDGMLTPPNSAAGSVPISVTTDENGIANFNVIYLKKFAGFVEIELTATTMVLGSETSSSTVFTLGISEGETCASLPGNPFPNGK